MLQNQENIIASRIEEVLHDLKRKKKLSKNSEISTVLNKSDAYVTEITKARMQPSNEFLQLLQNKYNVNTEYILEGIGDMYLSRIEEPQQSYHKKRFELKISSQFEQ